MRKLFFLFAWLLPAVSWAQPFNGGGMLGGLVSQVDGDRNEGYHKFGFFGGGYVSLKLSPRSSFQLEMTYIQKGSRLSGDSTGLSYGPTYTRLHYLEVPVIYQFAFAKRFQAEAGVGADVFLGSDVLVNGLEPPSLTVGYRTISLAGLAGISCYVTRHLKAGIRFNYSLHSIRKGPVEGQRRILFETGQYNNVISLGLSWDFRER